MRKIFYFLILSVAITGCKTRYVTREVEVEKEVTRHDTATVVKFQTLTAHDTLHEVTREVINTTTERYDTAGRIAYRQTTHRTIGAEKTAHSAQNASTASHESKSTSAQEGVKYKDRLIEKRKSWNERALEKLGMAFLALLVIAPTYVCFRFYRRWHL